MKLSIGIVGLPNVGKSTLFNALLKKQMANVAPYPFCTIEPNVGVVEVQDERLSVLAKITAIEKIVPAVVEFYDIAGLVKGASQGAGLGNQFLSHIRETAAIIHVVRLFEDDNVAHVSNKIDPLDDIKVVESELILADLATLDKQKEPSIAASKEERLKFEIIKRLKEKLNFGILAKNTGLTDEELILIKPLNLLTLKPVLYVFNVSEKQLDNDQETETKIREVMRKVVIEEFVDLSSLYLCAKLENEILSLNEVEQKEYLRQYHLGDTGLNRLIKKGYELLGLISFFTTTGEKEVRAWTISRGTLAPQAAGVIHTDFEKNFIRADVIPCQEFVNLDGWVKAREAGKVQTVGKDYVMQDGDVVEFKVGC